MNELKSHELSVEYLKNMFDEQVAERINGLMGNKKTILSKQYPCHGISEENESNPYYISFDINEKLLEAQIKSAINQYDLRKLFI